MPLRYSHSTGPFVRAKKPNPSQKLVDSIKHPVQKQPEKKVVKKKPSVVLGVTEAQFNFLLNKLRVSLQNIPRNRHPKDAMKIMAILTPICKNVSQSAIVAFSNFAEYKNVAGLKYPVKKKK